MPMVSEITPLLFVTKLEQYDYGGATAIAVVMLLTAFALLLAINALMRLSLPVLRASARNFAQR
jgi:sulfate transport system permease protein